MNASHVLEYFNESQWLYYIQSVKGTDTMHLAYIMTMAAIFVVGMVGNLVTCAVISWDRSMHTVTNYYLFNLAVTDLVLLVAMLVEMAFYSGQLSYTQGIVGVVICKVNVFIVGALWNNGILIITAVAVERYAAILRPLIVKKKRVRRRVARVMAGVWSVAMLETLPDVFTTTIIQTQRMPVCFVTLSWYARVVNGAAAVGTILLPLTVMLYVYAAIAITINSRHKHNLHEDNIFHHRNNRKRINNNIIALTLSFLVCWLPYFSLRVLLAFGGPQSLLLMAQNWELWYKAVCVCSWFSSVLNPLLFSLMSSKFRKALKNLWHTKLPRRSMKRVPVWT